MSVCMSERVPGAIPFFWFIVTYGRCCLYLITVLTTAEHAPASVYMSFLSFVRDSFVVIDRVHFFSFDITAHKYN
jgi:hypothetical protein